MSKPNDAYQQAGVDYSAMDPIKVLAQKNAAATSGNLQRHGATEVSASRGESAYVWEENDGYRALVIEGLGTKNLVADAMRAYGDKTYYDHIAQDTIAMVVNDLIVVGALPQVINAYFAIGDSDWMKDEQRASDLINGWAHATELSGATWGGGETPTLKGIINPDTIDLGGSAVGIIRNKEDLVLGDRLTVGDAIIMVRSSGIHANGLTLARKIAESLPNGFATQLDDGRSYGEALLTATPIYVPLVRELQERHIDIHYMVNITGHGWRKLMRATQSFRYIISTIPPVPTEFRLIQQTADISDEEMYSNFNMGAGFAVFVPTDQAEQAVAAIQSAGFDAWSAGTVTDGEKSVVIEPLGITFTGDSLEVR